MRAVLQLFSCIETIPKGTYSKQDKDIKVVGFGSHLVVSCKLPEDVVYGMTKKMADNVPAMAAVGKAMAGLTPHGTGRGRKD